MDGMHGSEAEMMHYLQDQHHHGLHNHISNGHAIDQDDHGDNNKMGSGGVNEVMDGDVSNIGNQSNDHTAVIPVGGSENNNQLTLSFRGQVFVFDSVTPERVQAVLLLLGGNEAPPNVPAVPVFALNNRDLPSTPQKLNVSQRLASLIRFREKRKERNFDKKIRYTVRKEVALRMQRNKGQFTSSKPAHDDSPANWESNTKWGTDGTVSQVQDVVCRTLCNACGLMWANKGTLKDLSKTTTATPHGTTNPLRNGTEDGNFEAEEMVLSSAGNGNNSS
ncbi:hypothetical protein OROGR_028808 [Orobanche gracilis]